MGQSRTGEEMLDIYCRCKSYFFVVVLYKEMICLQNESNMTDADDDDLNLYFHEQCTLEEDQKRF